MDAVPFRYLAQEYSLPNRSLPGWTLFLPVNLLPGTSFCAAFALTKSRVQGAAGISGSSRWHPVSLKVQPFNIPALWLLLGPLLLL